MINTHEQHEFWEMYDLLRELFPLEIGNGLAPAVDAMRARGVGAEALRSAHALGGAGAVKALMRGGRFVSAVQDEDLEFLESVLRGDWSAQARSHFLAALAEGDAGLTESVGAAACLGGWRAVEQLLADRAPGCGERVSAAVQDVLDNVGIPRGDRPR